MMRTKQCSKQICDKLIVKYQLTEEYKKKNNECASKYIKVNYKKMERKNWICFRYSVSVTREGVHHEAQVTSEGSETLRIQQLLHGVLHQIAP